MRLIIYIIIAFCLTGCGNNDDNAAVETDQDTSFVADENTEIKVQPLKYSDFSREIISNGKLSAFQKADLRFRSSENIARIYFKNGDRVVKNQTIALLDNFTLRNTFKQNKEQFERARLDLQDLLIGQGYSIADTSSVPKSTLLAARIKSGYDKALADLEMAQYNLDQSVLRAPFNGIVANLVLKENNVSAANDKFCTLIDNSRFEAEFMVLENELASLNKGQPVKIFPYAIGNMEFAGQISQINPVVDKNGMVTVKAVCTNRENLLAEGMNVRVIIEEKVPKQLVIPKLSVVLRSEKQVVFTLQNGLAKWNYVKTGLENSTSFTITEGLKAGDTVIVEGNLNLAHDSRIFVK